MLEKPLLKLNICICSSGKKCPHGEKQNHVSYWKLFLKIGSYFIISEVTACHILLTWVPSKGRKCEYLWVYIRRQGGKEATDTPTLSAMWISRVPKAWWGKMTCSLYNSVGVRAELWIINFIFRWGQKHFSESISKWRNLGFFCWSSFTQVLELTILEQFGKLMISNIKPNAGIKRVWQSDKRLFLFSHPVMSDSLRETG